LFRDGAAPLEAHPGRLRAWHEGCINGVNHNQTGSDGASRAQAKNRSTQMKASWLKVTGALSMVLASSLTACGASDDGFDVASESSDEAAYSIDESEEIGSLEQGVHNCATPDGTNAVMAALAVAAGQELGRWRSALDFEVNGSVIRLTSGTGSDGKPRGKSRCAGSVCPRIEALLSFQNSTATGVYVQAESSTTKVLVNPSALASRMVAKLNEQKTKDNDAKDGDTYQVPKTPFKLTGAGVTSALGGCGLHYKFNVVFDTTTTNPKPVPAQLKWALSFADQQNGWVDFRDLGNNVVAIDPTPGLNEEDATTVGSCTVACTKISTTNIANACCSCGGVNKTFKKATFNATTFLCQ
jgi:hypothetical protein